MEELNRSEIEAAMEELENALNADCLLEFPSNKSLEIALLALDQVLTFRAELLQKTQQLEEANGTVDDLKIIIGEIGERLSRYRTAEKEGRLVELPCKVGDTVYIVKENYFDCGNCVHGNEAHYCEKINRVCCDLEDRHCPHSIEEHIVRGFEIAEKDKKWHASQPGEWGYEGLEHFMGIDGECYFTPESAQAALEAQGK